MLPVTLSSSRKEKNLKNVPETPKLTRQRHLDEDLPLP